jgi:hypothetical protein
MTGAGFPHSEILGSQPGCRLPEAYRRLQRPSSAPGAKTSTVCSYKLDTACTTCKLQRSDPAKDKDPVQKMLASTVQFSRYGRNHASRTPVRRSSTAGRAEHSNFVPARRNYPTGHGKIRALAESATPVKRLLPQDPTACPEPSPFACPRSAAPRRGQRTDRAAAGK